MVKVYCPGRIPVVALLLLVAAACRSQTAENVIAIRNESFRSAAVTIVDGAEPRVRTVALTAGEEVRLDLSSDGNSPIEAWALDVNGAIIARYFGSASQLRDRDVMIVEDQTGATTISEVPRGGTVARSWLAPDIAFAIADEADPIGPPSRAFDSVASTLWRSLTPPRAQVTIAAAFRQTQTIAAVRASIVCATCGPIRLRVALLRRAPIIPPGLAPAGSAQTVSLLEELSRDPTMTIVHFEIAASTADGGWAGGRVPSGPIAAEGVAITILEAPENIGFYEVETHNGSG
ncbi:MAG: hypothetical protein EPO26_04045 [Chloroflexota bacterium]|nr:MAG: hypothetical protein EPO26_04045 [Chloroflexota bacterium]